MMDYVYMDELWIQLNWKYRFYLKCSFIPDVISTHIFIQGSLTWTVETVRTSNKDVWFFKYVYFRATLMSAQVSGFKII